MNDMVTAQGASILTAEVPAGELAKAIAIAIRTTSRRSTTPITGCLLLEKIADRLVVTGTDLDDTLSYDVFFAEGDDFSTCVDARFLRAVINAIPNKARVTLALRGDQLSIDAGEINASTRTMPAEDFPVTKTFGSNDLMMPANILRAAMIQVKHAISTEETRYYLNGIFMQPIDGELRMTTTDGHRMAHIRVPAEESTVKPFILRRSAVEVLVKLLSQRTTDMVIRQDSESLGLVEFNLGLCRLVTKAIDGTYPNYSRVIPTEVTTPNILTTTPEAVLKAVNALTFSNERSPVRLDLQEVSRMSREEQGFMMSVPLPGTFAGGQLQIGFQRRYLEALIGQYRGPLELRFGGKADPCLVRSLDGSTLIGVLMPMQIL